MTKRKPRGDHLWIGMGRGYRAINWCVNGLMAPGKRRPVAHVVAPSADEALVIARKNQPEGLYPLSVRRADGTGVTTYEL